MTTTRSRRFLLLGLLAGTVAAGLLAAVLLWPEQTVELPSQDRLRAVEDYIEKTWTTLTRSHGDLPKALPDPKVHHEPGAPWVLYVSEKEDPYGVGARIEAAVASEEVVVQVGTWEEPTDLAPEGGTRRFRILIKTLMANPREHVGEIDPHGLLYLPLPYVVPGGRFNEMYGWDSYFIQVGLLRDGEIDLARNMVDNFVYEIEHYGTILNANRTYYLTRSQPPFLTAMVLGVFRRTGDLAWLERKWPAIERYYEYWTNPPHLIPRLGLSRYHALGEGPAPEVVYGERDDDGRTHYDRVEEYYRTVPVERYDLSLYFDRSTDELTPLFFVGDRSMRESGFDPSNRFGPFSVDIIHYAPVCLNSLLYRMEAEAAEIAELLGREEDAAVWAERARGRRDRVNELLWDAEEGLYLDYRFESDTLSDYTFATTFYPLWVGLATSDQADRVVENLDRFETPGGVLTSTTVSGSQWDAPFGWAPLQMITVQGLRRYGYHDEADRLTAKFVGLVTKEFEEHGVIVEKYDVMGHESDVAEGLRFGYDENVVGFGWTNAVFVELLHAGSQGDRSPDRTRDDP